MYWNAPYKAFRVIDDISQTTIPVSTKVMCGNKLHLEYHWKSRKTTCLKNKLKIKIKLLTSKSLFSFCHKVFDSVYF